MLNAAEAVEQTDELLKMRKAELPILNRVRRYWKGKQPHPIVPRGVPTEIKAIAKMSRINLCGLVIDVLGQSLFVDGYRSPTDSDNAAAWDVWQANKMDSHQTSVHRSTFAYGTSYVKVVPGIEGVPVIQGRSPRMMTAAYGEDQAWPAYALEVLLVGKKTTYRLYDDELIYFLEEQSTNTRGASWNPQFINAEPHNMGRTPIVRFRNTGDLDSDEPCEGDEPWTCGEIEPLMPLQDQVEFTSFGLLVAQHFSAFKQRYIVGWTNADEDSKMQAAASRLMVFKDENIKLGEFTQTELSGYLKSREATIELIATIAQIPMHNVIGQMVNISADALVAADASNRRKVNERESTLGESWEQVFDLASIDGTDIGAEVRWRDTENRAFAATVDGLGKLATMLEVPVEMLWEFIPNWTDQTVERAKAMKKELDAIGSLNDLLNRQAEPATPAVPSGKELALSGAGG